MLKKVRMGRHSDTMKDCFGYGNYRIKAYNWAWLIIFHGESLGLGQLLRCSWRQVCCRLSGPRHWFLRIAETPSQIYASSVSANGAAIQGIITVPEPSGLALFSLVVAGVVMRRRRD